MFLPNGHVGMFDLFSRSLGTRAVLASTRAQQVHTLPALPYAYDALVPIINKDIMEVHHKKHHQAYVTNLNATEEKMTEAHEKGGCQIEAYQVIISCPLSRDREACGGSKNLFKIVKIINKFG